MTRTLCAVIALFAVAGLVVPFAEAGARFDNKDVDGPTAFAFDGFATVPVPGGGTAMVPTASTGRFTADGRGGIHDGARTLVVAGQSLRQTFTCQYNVNPNGTGDATCHVSPSFLTPTVPTSVDTETFDFVVAESKKTAFFTATTPGVTIRGATTRQQP